MLSPMQTSGLLLVETVYIAFSDMLYFFSLYYIDGNIYLFFDNAWCL